MTSSKKVDGTPDLATSVDGPVVVRSTVPDLKEYSEYRQYLRLDFLYSCACYTMSESEAQAIRFVIDHYEPRKARPDLENSYDNLMYACDECNIRKGDRCPPEAARSDGYRFFRPDRDIHREHFRRSGIRVEPITNTGMYTIESLDLNRLALRRLREIRERLLACDEHVIEGALGLRRFHIDWLPPQVRARASRAIRRALDVADEMSDEIDELLRRYAQSPYADPDPESDARARARLAGLKRLESLHAGMWRAPREKDKK